MKPNQEAKKLIDKFRPHAKYWDCYNDEPIAEDHAKKCALICVEEIINGINDMGHGEVFSLKDMDKKITFWLKVKQQLEK